MSKYSPLVIGAAPFVGVLIGIFVSNWTIKNRQEHAQWEYDKEHCVEWSREETLPRKCNCYDNEKCAKEAKQ